MECSKYGGGGPVYVVTYLGGPGEANQLTVARAGRAITLSDPAAAVTAEAPCVALDAHTASCDGGKPTTQGADSVAAQLGDGADSVTVAPGLEIVARLWGEDGDDVLTGGDEDDTIDGGRGADRVDGGSGQDNLSFAGRTEGLTVDAAAGRTSDGDVFTGIETLEGGDGPDRLLGGPGSEVLMGGGGTDTLRGAGGKDTLFGELGADRLDGGAGDDYLSGDPAQGDNYYTPRIRLRRDVLRGGSGDDTLTDSGGANVLLGGAGADVLRGGVDADRLSGGAGKDRLFGGAGADYLRARDGRRDRVDCGRGRDRARADAKDRVRACETLRRGVYTPSG